jgi:hypothetical protein
MLQQIVSSNYLKLLVSMILMITAATEVYNSYETIAAHHGILVFSIFQSLQSLVSIFAAAEYANISD